MSNTDTKSTAFLSRDLRVLCCFRDPETAGPYEKALTDCGVSLLRARHGMHAYWLAHTLKPTVAIIDAREMNLEADIVLSRIEQNAKLVNTQVLVIADERLPAANRDRFMVLSGDIQPADLAVRVVALLAEMDRRNQKNVDEIFSAWDDSQEDWELQPKRTSMIRTDVAKEVPSAYGGQDSARRKFRVK